MKKTIWLLVILCFACSLTAHAASRRSLPFDVETPKSIDGITVQVLPDFDHCRTGYNTIRVSAHNSSSREGSVQVKVGSRYGYGRTGGVAKSFTVAAGETKEVCLAYLSLGSYSPGGSVYVNGSELIRDLGIKYLSNSSRYGSVILADSKLTVMAVDKAFNDTAMSTYSRYGIVQFSGSVSQLYTQWLAYSKFALIIYHASTIREMSPEIRSALYDYVRLGGALMCFNDSEGLVLPADFAKLNSSKTGYTGFVPVTAYQCGYGKLYMTEEGILDDLATRKKSNWSAFSYNFGENRNKHEFTDEKEHFPRSLFMLFITAFAVIVGPVNLFLLAREKCRVYMFATIPIISSVFCMFIFSYYWIFVSGTCAVASDSLTMLDQRFMRSMTFASYSVYSAQSNDDFLHFDDNTEIYQAENTGRYDVDDRSIVLDKGQDLARGWLNARVPLHLYLRTIRSSRERLDVEYADGVAKVNNGLGANIEKLYLVDSKGNLYEGSNIGPGKSEICQLTSFYNRSYGYSKKRITSNNKSLSSKIADQERLSVQDGEKETKFIRLSSFVNVRNIDEITSEGRSLLPNTYLAKLSRSKFIQVPLEGASSISEKTWVYGVLEDNK